MVWSCQQRKYRLRQNCEAILTQVPFVYHHHELLRYFCEDRALPENDTPDFLTHSNAKLNSFLKVYLYIHLTITRFSVKKFSNPIWQKLQVYSTYTKQWAFHCHVPFSH